VLISVDDPGLSDSTPQMQDADISRVGGNGLGIVNQLARHWGSARGADAESRRRLGLVAGLTGGLQDLVRGPGWMGPLVLMGRSGASAG
jgi:hypothetical protein